MNILSQIIIASSIVGAISLVGIVIIMQSKKQIDINLKNVIGIASGVLLASVFLELLPEVFENPAIDPGNFFAIMLMSILGFYLIERLIHWHHCHGANCPSDSKTHVAVTNLMGDGIHNFIDGILIATAFLVSPEIGIATTIAIIAHEIPQEISDAGILLHAGMSKAKVILYNFIFAMTSVVGALLAFFYTSRFESIMPMFIAIAAGNFIYLALADLVPELHREQEKKKIAQHTLWLFAGVAIFWLISRIDK